MCAATYACEEGQLKAFFGKQGLSGVVEKDHAPKGVKRLS